MMPIGAVGRQPSSATTFFVETCCRGVNAAGKRPKLEVLPQPVSDTYSEARQYKHYASTHGPARC